MFVNVGNGDFYLERKRDQQSDNSQPISQSYSHLWRLLIPAGGNFKICPMKFTANWTKLELDLTKMRIYLDQHSKDLIVKLRPRGFCSHLASHHVLQIIGG